MLLSEAKEVLKKNGFILEAMKADNLEVELDSCKLGNKEVKVGDGVYKNVEDPTLGYVTKIVQKGKKYLISFQWYLSKNEMRYEVDTGVAFSMGTYGNAIVHPVIQMFAKLNIDKNRPYGSSTYVYDEAGYMLGIMNPKTGRVNSPKSKVYFNDKYFKGAEVYWGEASDERALKILEEHPELQKDWDAAKKESKALDMHK